MTPPVQDAYRLSGDAAKHQRKAHESLRGNRVELGLLLERELTTLRPPGGTITDVHVCQRDCGRWHINVRVSWRGTALFHVGLYDKKRIRLYKKAASAIRHIVLGYGYEDVIHVHPWPGLKDQATF